MNEVAKVYEEEVRHKEQCEECRFWFEPEYLCEWRHVKLCLKCQREIELEEDDDR